MNALTGSVPWDLSGRAKTPEEYKAWLEKRKKKPMRDLEQYPITTDEIIQCLKELMDEVAYEKTGLVGDMRPLLLANAIQLVSASAPAQRAPTKAWKDGRLEPCEMPEFIQSLRRYSGWADQEFGTRSDPAAHLGERLNAAADALTTLTSTER